MIVVNKRYYDYDYDNNTIIMFDAEDVGLTLDLDDTIYSLDDDELEYKSQQEIVKKQQASDPSITHTAMQSESTDTVPDDTLIVPNTPPNNTKMDVFASNLTPSPPNKSPKLSSSSSSSGVSWISSASPKGMRHIPYSLFTAHSYTISQLEVSFAHLVDKKQYLREQKEYEAKQAAILAQKQQQQYAQQYGHNPQYMNNNQHLRYYAHGPPQHPTQAPQAAPPQAYRQSSRHRPYVSAREYNMNLPRNHTPPQAQAQRKQDISPPAQSRYGPSYNAYPT